uniref:Uncharacterized protein n=1 Tax=Magallana gigas TaxID=29159 RepID=K1Q721_MAGGI
MSRSTVINLRYDERPIPCTLWKPKALRIEYINVLSVLRTQSTVVNRVYASCVRVVKKTTRKTSKQ